jgi:predicted dehydrogenase
VHVIDLRRWFWRVEVTEVYAEVGYSLLHPGLGIDDAGLLSFMLSNGIYGSLDTSWSRPSSYPVWGDVKIEVVGERGVIYVDALHQYITVASNATGKTQWVSYGSDIDRGLMIDFVEMVRSDRAPSITGEDGLAALAVALAAYESAHSGQPVTLHR